MGAAALFALIVAATPAADAAAGTSRSTALADRRPPVIEVRPSVANREGTLLVRARVSDPSGAGAVTAWVRGEKDSAFHAFPMQPVGERGAFVVELPAEGQLAYFIEAYDDAGNGPTRAGTPEEPILSATHAQQAVIPAGGFQIDPWSAWAVVALVPLVVVACFRVLRRRRGDADVEFWIQLVGPLSDKGGAELMRHIERISTTVFDHPTRGKVRPTRGEVVAWLRRLRESEPPRLARLRASGRVGSDEPAGAAATAATPVADKELCPGSRDGRGVTAVELLVVLAIIGLAAGIALLWLKPMEAPVRTAGELVEGFVRQTRASAMSTTTAHRLRPFSSHRLVVERALGCHAEAWTAVPGQELELPRDVTLSPSDWTVCFSARGTTDENVLFALEHPQYPTRRLEILLGGAVRWLD